MASCGTFEWTVPKSLGRLTVSECRATCDLIVNLGVFTKSLSSKEIINAGVLRLYYMTICTIAEDKFTIGLYMMTV